MANIINSDKVYKEFGVKTGENTSEFFEIGADAKNVFIQNTEHTQYGDVDGVVDLQTKLDNFNKSVRNIGSGVAANNYAAAFGYRTSAEGEASHAEGAHSVPTNGVTILTQAKGVASHAEGRGTISGGEAAHSEGYLTQVGNTATLYNYNITPQGAAGAHAEGLMTIATNLAAHAEGIKTQAKSPASHAEGEETTVTARGGHAEGGKNVVSGTYAHAEGELTVAIGGRSHAEGRQTLAQGENSHAEGYQTKAESQASHAEGEGTEATNWAAHAEGRDTIASGESSHAEGLNSYAYGYISHAEGQDTRSEGWGSHSEGISTHAIGDESHAEGGRSIAKGKASHAEGCSLAGGDLEDRLFPATLSEQEPVGFAAHAEGNGTWAKGHGSHAEGFSTIAYGKYSHVEGGITRAEGDYSHAEGFNTQALGANSHVEGSSNIGLESTKNSHIEGFDNRLVSGEGCHIEGYGNQDWTVQNIETSFYKMSENSIYLDYDLIQLVRPEEINVKFDGRVYAYSYSYLSSNSLELPYPSTGEDDVKYYRGSLWAGRNTTIYEQYNIILKQVYANEQYYNNLLCIEDLPELEDALLKNLVFNERGVLHSQQISGMLSNGAHVQGRYSVLQENLAHIVGGGTSLSDRRNIHTIDWDGNAIFAGDIDFYYTVSDDQSLNKIISLSEKILELENRLKILESK